MSETGIDVMSSGDESDAEPMYMDMLEDIRVRSQSNPSINRREAHYKTSDCFKQSRPEWKGALLSMQNMGKGLQKLLKTVVNEISEALPILGESGSEVSHLIPEPRNFEEVKILPEDIRKHWLKENLNYINNLINNQTF